MLSNYLHTLEGIAWVVFIHAILTIMIKLEGVALIYEQNIYWTKINYVNDRFWREFNWMSGIREENNKGIKIYQGNKLLDEMGFVLGDKRIKKLSEYFRLMKKTAMKSDLDFDAILYLHNEMVAIDKSIRDNRSFGFVRIIIKKQKVTIYSEDVPILTHNLNNIEEIINNTVSDCCKKYDSIGIKKERKKFNKIPHVLSAKAAGFFVHEIIGHLLESDYYRFFKAKYNELNISHQLTVADSVEEGINLAGVGRYDDNGNRTESIVLIENGKINNIISTDESLSFNNRLYGFARRASFKESVMPRMRNTYIKPYQKMCKQDILNQYKTALYIEEINLGIVNYCSGEFQLYGNGFIVNNGMIQNFVDELCVYGNIKKDISMIDYIGNDFKIYGGYCGKMGQSVHVGTGSPTISLLEMISEGVIYE